MASTYAGTWLAWLDRLRQIDCWEMQEDFDFFDHPQCGTDEAKHRREPAFRLFVRELEHFRRDLGDQEIEFLKEKGDWDGALTVLMNRMGSHIKGMMTEQTKQVMNRRGLSNHHCFADWFAQVSLLENCSRWVDALSGKSGESTLDQVTAFLDCMISGLIDEEADAGRAPQILDDSKNKKAVKVTRVSRRKLGHGSVRESQERELEPAEVVNSFSLALDFSNDLVEVADVLRWLGIANEDETKNWSAEDVSKNWSARCLSISSSIIGKLRRLLIVLATSTESKEPSAAPAVARRYSESIQHFLRSKTDQVDLARAFQHALAKFWRANPWFDSPKRLRQGGSRVYDGKSESNEFIERAREAAIALHELTRQTVYDDEHIYNLYRARSLLLWRGPVTSWDWTLKARWADLRGTRLLAIGDPVSALGQVAPWPAPNVSCFRQTRQSRMRKRRPRTAKGGRDGLIPCRSLSGSSPWHGRVWSEHRMFSLARDEEMSRGGSDCRLTSHGGASSLQYCTSSAILRGTRSATGIAGNWIVLTRSLRSDCWAFARAWTPSSGSNAWMRTTVSRLSSGMRHERSGMRSAKLWLSLLSTTYWHDAMQYRAMEIMPAVATK